MSQYKKLFDKSEIEYITPFLKLWMAFNNWYKQDLNDVNTDRAAINEYKQQGLIKVEFLKLFSQNSDEGLSFQNALYEVVLNLKSYDLRDKNNTKIEYSNGLILENAGRQGGKQPIYISFDKKRFQIDEQKKELFFEETLEIIYQIRCSLVHGSFDIENPYFTKLVKSIYEILYPIMERILLQVEEKTFHCTNRRGTDAHGKFNSGSVIVLKDSKICKDVVNSYEKKEERISLLSAKSKEEEKYFILTEDVEFSSPSSASSFCLGNSSNGWLDWKTKNGKTMNEILRENQE